MGIGKCLASCRRGATQFGGDVIQGRQHFRQVRTAATAMGQVANEDAKTEGEEMGHAWLLGLVEATGT
jgi:hypothetical protein